MWQVNLRSTLGKSVVNEVRTGVADAMGDGTYFGKGVSPDQFNCTGLGCQQANGQRVQLRHGERLTATRSRARRPTAARARASRPSSACRTRVTWLKGKHSMSFGGDFARTDMRNTATTPYETSLSFGLSSLDTTAYNMLDQTSGNYPGGITSTNAGYARNLYAFLTGRVSTISSTYYLQPDGTYLPNGPRGNGAIADEIGGFFSDSWRVKPNLTLTLGARYQVQLPMKGDGLYSKPETWQMVYGITGANDSGIYGSGNLYKPGVMTGTAPVVVKYDNDNPPYNTDWNNIRRASASRGGPR